MNKIKDVKNEMVCPICGTKMKVFDYAYDQNQYGKKYYKCDECGHKMNTMS